MTEPTWEDTGPVSQGKIITAVLQKDNDTARSMLRGWSHKDKVSLYWACETVKLLIQEQEHA